MKLPLLLGNYKSESTLLLLQHTVAVETTPIHSFQAIEVRIVSFLTSFKYLSIQHHDDSDRFLSSAVFLKWSWLIATNFVIIP